MLRDRVVDSLTHWRIVCRNEAILYYYPCMGITVSHTSALYMLRMMRAQGYDFTKPTNARLVKPTPWVGERWGSRAFDDSLWAWQKPKRDCHLDILVRNAEERVRMRMVDSHICATKLPKGSILWVDEHASIVSPELLFVQMAGIMSLPALVLLGYELCGHYARCPEDPINGPVADELPAVTSVSDLRRYATSVSALTGKGRAVEALEYVNDNAISAPEGLLGTFFSLPMIELGYGMGHVTLNRRLRIHAAEEGDARHRYPDIMFSFAPIGINYDGEDHLELSEIVEATKICERADKTEERAAALTERERVCREVRAKAVDVICRDRDLASEGVLVFRVVKEDLSEEGGLDKVIRRILGCARNLLGVDTTPYEAALDDTELCRERNELLRAFWPHGESPMGRREVV